MDKNWKLFLSLGAIVVLAGLGSIFMVGGNKNETLSSAGQGAGVIAGAASNEGADYIERLSKNLSEKGVVLYGSSKSAETQQQKELFGSAAKSLDFVECDSALEGSNPDECAGKGIEVYPTWSYEGQQYRGVQSLSQLAKIAKFEQ